MATPPAIDIHAHVGTPECAQLVEGLDAGPLDPFSFHGGAQSVAYNRAHFAQLQPKLVDPQVRLSDMDRMGIDLQALSVAPPQFYYWVDPGLGRRLARLHNEHLAGIVAAHPDRFVGLATVPLQDVEAAIAELRYGVRELGFRGVEICTSVNGLDLDDRRFRPFFAAVQELDVPVLLHPHGFSDGRRLAEFYFGNVIGNPLDSTVALARLIHGGVLEQLPRLRLCLVHGGGFLPFYTSRMDHSYAVRPEGRAHLSRPPSSYLSQVYVDSLVYDALHLRHLIDRMGADHVVLGTDYPYDMGHYDPLGQLSAVDGLTAEERDLVRSGTAATLLKLAG